MENKPLKFLVADDHMIVRQGIQLIIEELVPNFELQTVSSLAQIQKEIREQNFDIAILDAQFQDGNSISILPEFKKLQPEVKILMFTSFDEENYAIKFIQAGADGFLSKLSEESEIQNALSEMIQHGKYHSLFVEKMLSATAYDRDLFNPLSQLSERELQVAELFVTGAGNLEIANKLNLKQNTVSTFKKRIFKKLKINSLVELIELMRIHHSL